MWICNAQNENTNETGECEHTSTNPTRQLNMYTSVYINIYVI